MRRLGLVKSALFEDRRWRESCCISTMEAMQNIAAIYALEDFPRPGPALKNNQERG